MNVFIFNSIILLKINTLPLYVDGKYMDIVNAHTTHFNSTSRKAINSNTFHIPRTP